MVKRNIFYLCTFLDGSFRASKYIAHLTGFKPTLDVTNNKDYHEI